MPHTIDLSGTWELSSPQWKERTLAADLPGDNYSALLAAGVIPDPYYGRNELLVQEFREYDWVYAREFEMPEDMLELPYIYLNCEMVDTFAEISINGRKVLRTDNAFCRWRPEVRKYLKPGRNAVTVLLRSAARRAGEEAQALAVPVPMNPNSRIAGMNLIRKPHCHAGWDWGITLMVSGVYAPLTLTAVRRCRIDAVWTEQKHESDKGKLPGKVRVAAVAEVFAYEAGRETVTFTFDGKAVVVKASLKPGLNRFSASFEIANPRLWWPNGYGEPELYTLEVATPDETVQKEIGLRTVEVINAPDGLGLSMFFRVNGVDVFAKGANWIPCDALPSRQTPERYDHLLESARLAHMNMIRIWGGGQYEKDIFYELCDRKGLLVWQDMMFACSLYPATEEFIATVSRELDFQIPRLRHHACLALWCGDNEVIGATGWYGKENRTAYLIQYDRLNRELARQAAVLDPDRVFWPSSPCGGPGNFNDGWHDDNNGDMHYWEVWHGGKDFNAYYHVKPRFCSEFGFQSFPSEETVETYLPDDQRNVFSPVMDHHQKCPHGNTPIINMFSRYFRMPERFTDFLYLSQVQQALAIKTGVEFWRMLKPRCMGAVYWQLNDNWPVASWSGIEYCGKWKQLHYHARRFFAPVIGVIYRDPADGVVRLFAVSDVNVRLRIECKAVVRGFDGVIHREFAVSGALKPLESRCLKEFRPGEFRDLDPAAYFIELETTARSAGEEGPMFHHCNTFHPEVFKRCDLAPARVDAKVFDAKVSELQGRKGKGGAFRIRLQTDLPAFFVTLDSPGIAGLFSDNSFTLLPDRPAEVIFTPAAPTDAAMLRQALTVTHLRDTYR